MLNSLRAELKKGASKDRAERMKSYFRNGNDIFLGVSVPYSHEIAKKYKSLPRSELNELLHSKIHEDRLVALNILIYQFIKATEEEKEEIVSYYLKNTKYIDNWDLIDGSAPKILGNYLLNRDRVFLYALAKSKDMWERRIAMVSTYTFIKNNDLNDTFAIAEILLSDTNDLIHKAVGWMLREAGKKDQKRLEAFLKKHYSRIPRTTLRYAIEKFGESLRLAYIKGKWKQ